MRQVMKQLMKMLIKLLIKQLMKRGQKGNPPPHTTMKAKISPKPIPKKNCQPA
ncbi:hypothetical protein D3C78_1891400 [compost metagenome]